MNEQDSNEQDSKSKAPSKESQDGTPAIYTEDYDLAMAWDALALKHMSEQD